ncbi:hypothetical protein L7F22_025482 [Adiantum nelumboides]|nr:hypothetical protein [Adiantum nelumboides]
MQTLLMIKNMWKIVMGEVPRPAHGDQRNDWDRRALQDQGLININVKDTLVGYIRSATSAKEAWDILARRFEGKSIIKEAFRHWRILPHFYFKKRRDLEKTTQLQGTNHPPLSCVKEGDTIVQVERRHGRGFHRNNNSRFAASSNSTPTHNTNQPFEGRRDHHHQGSRGRGNGRRIGNCYNCGIFGHWQRDCTRSGRPQITNGPSNNKVSNYASSSSNPHHEEAFLSTYMAHLQEEVEDGWYVDSGASNHMTYHHYWFTLVEPFEGEGSVLTGDDSHHAIQGKRTITIQMSQGEEKDLSNVLLVPGITKNLISVGQIVEKGYEVKFNKDGCYVKNDKGKVVAHGEKNGRIFKLKMNVTHNANFSSHSSSSSLILWHKRLGHISHQSIMHLKKEELVEGLPTFQVNEEPNLCSSCQFGKQQRRRFNKSTYQARQPLELIHSDVWGPSQTTSMGGAHYFLTFVDDMSRKVWVYFLKNKSEVFSYFKQFKAMVEKECGRFIKTLRSDQGGNSSPRSLKNFVGIKEFDDSTHVPTLRNKMVLQRGRIE